MSSDLLPPWPDELLVPEMKERAIAHLRGLGIPSRIAASHLTRWAAYVGVTLDRRDYASVGRFVKREE
jgi:hypothetical protein